MSQAQHRDPGTETPEGPQPAGGVIRQAPTVLIVAVTVLALGLLTAFVLLILAGKPTTELLDAIKLVLGGVSSIGALGGLLYGASAAKSAKAAREQTNGSLDARIEAHVAKGVAAALDELAPGGGPLPQRPRGAALRRTPPGAGY